MDELRVSVIGVGRMGLTHAENLAHRVRGARLVAVTTSSAERAAEVRRRCGAVSVYEKIEHLLEGERLDAAVISSSTSARLATVYRTLALLKKFGMVSENNLGEEHGHFEATPENPHHHFTCLGCKRVLELKVPCIEDFVKGLGINEALVITGVNLSFEGYCSDCQPLQEV